MTAASKMQVETRDREIVFTRMFDAPRQLVWDCWIMKEHLLKWFGPHGFTNKDCSVDLKPGGDLLITMVGMGNEYPCRLVFNEIVPIERIVCTDKVIPGDVWGPDGPPPDSILTLLFEDLGKQTKVTMITRFDTNEGRDRTLKMGAVDGWSQSLEKLDELLASL